ncbi:hypothetical protein CRUP_014080 [Coryphaenoides rupestris]|nr:hypothetical protein CRUP_014080 [Coryphaenoides rupestris]
MARPQLAFAVLALACLGVASEHDCDELVKPMTDFSSASGKWIFHAGTADSEDALAKLKTIISSWIHPKYSSDGSCPEPMEIADKIEGKCVYIDANLTTIGDRVVMECEYNTTSTLQCCGSVFWRPCCICLPVCLSPFTDTFENHTQVNDGQHLETCDDCLMWTGTTKGAGSVDGKQLFIFTRNGNLSLPHLEVFKQQAACLNFTLGLHMGSVDDLCPERKDEKEPKEGQ